MISTDEVRINTDLLHAELTYKIRGAIFNVYNELGYGHKEHVYSKALEEEFTLTRLRSSTEQKLQVRYKGKAVGIYRPDFVIDDKVIIELKAVEYMTKAFEHQLLHYLKTTGFSLGLLVNFGTPKLYIKRIIWTPNLIRAHPSSISENPKKT